MQLGFFFFFSTWSSATGWIVSKTVFNPAPTLAWLNACDEDTLLKLQYNETEAYTHIMDAQRTVNSFNQLLNLHFLATALYQKL